MHVRITQDGARRIHWTNVSAMTQYQSLMDEDRQPDACWRRARVTTRWLPPARVEKCSMSEHKGISDIDERTRTEAALRHSEASLRAIVETTPECVHVIGGDGTLLSGNAAGAAMA